MLIMVDYSGGTPDKYGGIKNPSLMSVLCAESEKSKKEKYPVYILTKEGKVYNEDGLYYLRDTLKMNNKDIIFTMGKDLNDPYVLTKFIENKTELTIICSVKDFILTIRPKDKTFDKTIKLLNSDFVKQNRLNSWETFLLTFPDEIVEKYPEYKSLKEQFDKECP